MRSLFVTLSLCRSYVLIFTNPHPLIEQVQQLNICMQFYSNLHPYLQELSSITYWVVIKLWVGM